MPDTLADFVKLALVALGGGGAGWLGPMIRDAIRGYKPKAERAQVKADKEDRSAIDITEQLRKLAADAVADVREEIGIEREKTKRLTARVGQLERVLRDNHLEVPAEVLPPEARPA